MMATAMPDERGNRLLPAVLNKLAHDNPEGSIMALPKTSRPEQGYNDISYSRLANAVNKICHWLEELGAQSRDVVAYLGPTDTRYPILLLAALKLDTVMFFPSPHNTTTVQAHLLSATKSTRFLYASEYAVNVNEILSNQASTVPIKGTQVPSLDHFLAKDIVEPVPYTCIFDEVRHKPFVILHTSGTTGIPKPIPLPHGYYSHEDLNQCAAYQGNMTSQPFKAGARLLTTMSMWHVGGIFYGLLKPILNGIVTVMTPPGLPLTGDLLHSCLFHSRANMVQAAPATLAEMIAEPLFEDSLRKLECIITGSGPMPDEAGKRLLALNQRVYNYFGLTESNLLPQLPLEDPSSEWQYQRFHPLSGVSFRTLGDDAYELVLVRLGDGPPQPCFELFPESDVFHSKDVFSRHHTKPDLWKWMCRLDDIVTLSTGEKIVPTDVETRLASIPGVKSALLVGQGRRCPALLLELMNASNRHSWETFWPEVDIINKTLPTYGRVPKELAAITDSPFPRTPKGTIKRREAEKQSAKQIDAMYRSWEAHTTAASPVALTGTSVPDLIAFLQQAVESITGSKLDADFDLLAARSLDSMMIMQLVRVINSAVAGSSAVVKVTPSLLYSQRTIRKAGEGLHRMISIQENKRETNGPSLGPDNSHLSDLLAKLVASLPDKVDIPAKKTAKANLKSVVLTGSTGSLGLHLLHVLLHETSISRIDCLNRSANARKLYLSNFPADGEVLGKAHFHCTTNLNKPCLGLESDRYKELLASATTIIHNAWPVHFHFPLEPTSDEDSDSFGFHDKTLVSLAEFSTKSMHRPNVVFISSLSTVSRFRSGSGDPKSIPEAIIDNPTAAGSLPYAQSKWIGEHILATAVQRGLISATIIRPGDIAGPTGMTGVAKGSLAASWNAMHSLPSLVLSSAAVGALPSDLHEADKLRWVPVDVCAHAVVEIAATSAGASGLGVSNIINIVEHNGVEKTWSVDAVPVIKRRLEQRTPQRQMEVMPLAEWARRVVDYGPKPENPAYRLIDFYERRAHTASDQGFGGDILTRGAKERSATLQRLGPIRDEWLESWMEGWGL
jgi:acyl-coenzyme A synthetase/AMP-(fatty) acid ligase/thioester reductase-like protein